MYSWLDLTRATGVAFLTCALIPIAFHSHIETFLENVSSTHESMWLDTEMGANGFAITEAWFKSRDKYEGCLVPEANYSCETISIDDIVSGEWFYTNYVQRRWPVIIKTKDEFRDLQWDTYRWKDLTYLKQRAGSAKVRVEFRNSSQALYGATLQALKMTFSEFLDKVYGGQSGAAGANLYLNLQSESGSGWIEPPMTTLGLDLHIPSFYLRTVTKFLNLWMGKSDPDLGSATRTHFDRLDNLYAVIRGRKTFTLLDPSNGVYVYPNTALKSISKTGIASFGVVIKGENSGEGPPHFSPLGDLNNVNLTQYPLYQKARPMVCDVQTGDMLYLPAGWWHNVRSFGAHVAVNFWQEPAPPDVTIPDRYACAKSKPTEQGDIRLWKT
eukprot:m.138450 g.138450  ORF g.138450 m.138450 type:complete len:384 (+) comp24037_c1_seq5:1871-3022(+)